MPFSTTDGALILYVYQSNISDWGPSLDLKRSVLANSVHRKDVEPLRGTKCGHAWNVQTYIST